MNAAVLGKCPGQEDPLLSGLSGKLADLALAETRSMPTRVSASRPPRDRLLGMRSMFIWP